MNEKNFVNICLTKLTVLFLVITIIFGLSVDFSFAVSSPTFTSRSKSADYFTDSVLEHKPTINFTLISKDKRINSKNIYYKKLIYDNGSNFNVIGDYIRYSLYDSYNCDYSVRKKANNVYSHTFNLKLKYRTSESQEVEFLDSLDYVMPDVNLDSLTQYEKVKLIYDYICTNVTYDYSKSNSRTKYTAYSALINGTSVCQGYASLFYVMCKYAGVPVRIITGKGDSGPHAWNIVKIGKFYYNVDATWDASIIQKQIKHYGEANRDAYKYFLKSNSQFKKHTRNKEYKLKSFTKLHPMSNKSYVLSM